MIPLNRKASSLLLLAAALTTPSPGDWNYMKCEEEDGFRELIKKPLRNTIETGNRTARERPGNPTPSPLFT